MVAIIVILIVVLAISFVSETHALGLWVFMMITHGFLVELIGEAAVHLPMYAGFMIMAITIGRRKWTSLSADIWLLMSGLVAFMTLAALLGIDPASSIEDLIKYSKGFVLTIFVAGVIKDENQIRIVTLYCVAAAFAGTCLAISQYVTGVYTIDVYDVERAAGLSGDPNHTAMLLLIGLPVSLYWFTHSDNRYVKLLFACVFILTIGAITLTQSRGGSIALALVLILIFLRRPSIKAFSVGIVFVFAGLLFASEEYWERLETISTIGENSEYGSIDTRYRYLVTGVEAFLRNPVLGVGMGNFGRAIIEVDSDFDTVEAAAHNMYLEFFVENGTLAGLLFLALLASAVIRAIRYDTYSQFESSAYGLGFCFSMSLIAVMAAGLFLSQGKSSVLWFFVGIGLAFSRLIRSSKAMRLSRSPEILIDHFPRSDGRKS